MSYPLTTLKPSTLPPQFSPLGQNEPPARSGPSLLGSATPPVADIGPASRSFTPAKEPLTGDDSWPTTPTNLAAINFRSVGEDFDSKSTQAYHQSQSAATGPLVRGRLMDFTPPDDKRRDLGSIVSAIAKHTSPSITPGRSPAQTPFALSPAASNQQDGGDNPEPEEAVVPVPPKAEEEAAFKISNFKFYLICAVLMTDAVGTSMLYSYVGLLVAHVEPSLDQSSAGYVAGLLVGCFQAVQVFALPVWGRASDVVGRKPILLISLFLSVSASVFFGLSSSFYMLMATRAFHGAVGAGVAVGKTYIFEVTTAKSQARGFGLMNLSWSLGTFVGPTVGGFLYDVNNSPIFSKFLPRLQLYDDYPALGPATALATYALVVGVLAFHYLPESMADPVPVPVALGMLWTNIKRRFGLEDEALPEPAEVEIPPPPSFAPEVDDAPPGSLVISMESPRLGADIDDVPVMIYTPQMGPTRFGRTPRLMSPAMSEDSQELTTAYTTEIEVPEKSGEEDSYINMPHANMHRLVDSYNTEMNQQSSMSTRDILVHPLLRSTIPMGMILASFNIAYNEVFPLYAIAYKADGGLGFSSTQVGMAGMMNAVVALVCNGFFERMCNRFKLVNLWIISCIGLAISMFLLAFFSYLPSPTACLIAFLPLCLVRTSSSSWTFGLSMMFNANAAPKKHIGTVTSIAQSGTSLARSITPVIAAPIFAWSVSSHGNIFPFNHFLIFLLCAGGALTTAYMGRLLPNSVISVRRK